MEQTKKLNMTAMSDKTNSNTTAKKEEPAWEHKVAMKVSGVSIAVNLLLSLFKLLAGILAHSGAMISDAIHSASDVGSTFVVIVGVNLSSKKSDKEHQYGHERMECVSSIILSGLLLATGIGIGMNGIENIIKSTSGASIAIPGTLALIAAVVSIVVKEWMFWYTRSAAKKINSGALMADAWHHRSDAMSSVGAFIGILGARLGFPILDPIASVAICVLIVKASVDIFRDAIDKMVDHSCDEATEESMREVIMGVKGVKGIDLLQTRLFGSKMYVDIEISADGEIPLNEAHDVAENVHHTIEKNFKERDIFVEYLKYDYLMLGKTGFYPEWFKSEKDGELYDEIIREGNYKSIREGHKNSELERFSYNIFTEEFEDIYVFFDYRNKATRVIKNNREEK